MSDIIIKVENLTKTFKLYNHSKDRLKEALSPFRKKYHHEYHALNDISFEVKRGESIGILGKNGAGKSTLLKVLTGVLTPTSGKIMVNGRIAALLELGSGFNPELSGMENIYFQGAIMGCSQEEMESKVSEIVDFADIGEFITQPVKTYSSGMFARLAFSVAINVDPDILIVDEALSVGDAFFQAKCFLKIKKLKEKKNLTFIFVSHSISAVKNICSQGLLLQDGRIAFNGSASQAAEKYFAYNVKSNQSVILDKANLDSNDFSKKAAYARIKNGIAEFTDVAIFDDQKKRVNVISYGQEINLKMEIVINHDVDLLAFGFHVRNQDGIDVLFSSSGVDVDYLENLKKGATISIENFFSMDLIQGNYTVTAVLSRPIDIENGVVDFCDFIPIALGFEMYKREPVPIYGLVGIKNKAIIIKS